MNPPFPPSLVRLCASVGPKVAERPGGSVPFCCLFTWMDSSVNMEQKKTAAGGGGENITRANKPSLEVQLDSLVHWNMDTSN